MSPRIDATWLPVLKSEFDAPYFAQLKAFLVDERAKHTVYPQGNQIFSAFNHTPFDKVKVVILGQDPYHGPGQANGLCFSVSPGISQPPSLKNIFKEINTDLGIPIPRSGDLTPWANQGVFLLNTVLTVRAGEANSHKNKGWERFTSAVIQKISEQKQDVVFLLWGNPAKQKEELIDTSKHHVLKAAHPSPLAGGAFFGSKHFSKTNEILRSLGQAEIDWRVE
ncbi:MAG: uracil-DNA glycosylase [Sphingobacteriales bacterium JAD_PAG50586_3]|nr:MAG: uracil-DNA glycosylase [Sphingobacteriales bacterium JAD_PAG50586_3]